VTIQVHCAKCGRRLVADDRQAGTRFKCPGCGAEGIVPQSGARQPAAPQAAPAAKTPAGADGDFEPVEFGTKMEADEELDMTPMVDVTFLLLIFFMVTAAFSMQKSIEVPSPDQQESAAQARTLEDIEKDDDYVIIEIRRDNTILVNEYEAPGEQEVLVQLREAREGSPGTTGRGPSSLLVLADGECRHETVVMCLDAGNAVGMENVRLATVDEEDLR